MALPARSQVELGLSPMRVELNLAPGAQRTGALTLANASPQAGRFRVEVLDLSIDSEAVPQFEPDIASEADFSCRKWVTVNPMEADIAAGREMFVRYTFRVPATAPSRTYHCALGFTAVADPKAQKEAVGIVALIRLAGTFYITVGNPAPLGEIRQIAIEPTETPGRAGYRVLISVENSGMTNLRGAGTVDILSETGKVVQSSAFPSVIILPDRIQRLPFVLSDQLADGLYTLHARVNLGTREIQDASVQFQLPLAARD